MSAPPLNSPPRSADETAPPRGISRKPETTSRPRIREHLDLALLLVATAALYLWNLSASGWANAFYAAAAQAGGENWEAWFFGSSDAANAITVDKPPAALWVTGLAVRLFGLSPWSILVPQALMGVGTTWILYLAVRRAVAPVVAPGDRGLAHRGGLLAAAALALTPVAALMFRFNNPDALLVLLMTAAGYAVLRAVQSGRLRWLLFCAALIGLGFLTKQLQALLVVPGFALAYLWAAPQRLSCRLLHLLAALATMIAAAGWWIAVVELVPAESRPYIGGSQGNSILELTLGYNGLGRLNGEEVGSVGAGGNWGTPGLLRLFSTGFGGQIAWLLPSALALGIAVLWIGRRAPRTDAVRTSVLIWGGWIIVTGVVFSLMQGIIHEYYTVALAPGIAALIGLGGALLWSRRREPLPAAALALATLAAGLMAFLLLGRADGYVPWLRWAVLGTAVASVLLLLLSAAGFLSLPGRGVARMTASLSIVTALAGPLAFTLTTIATPHSGAIVTAGPTSSGGVQGRGPGGVTRPDGAQPPWATGTTAQPGAGGAGGGMGGLLTASSPAAEVTSALQADAEAYTWAAAVVGSNNAAGYQLATELPVMAVGGFNGTDPAPTLEEFQRLVAEGRIHYFIASSMMQGDSGSDAAAEITAWVEQNFTAQMVGGATLYDLG